MLLCGCAASKTAGGSYLEKSQFDLIQQLNYTNGSRITEDPNGIVYFIGSDEDGIFRWNPDGTKECVVQASVYSVYYSDEMLYYHLSDDKTWRCYSISDGTSTVVTRLRVNSVVDAGDAMYLSARQDFYSPFYLYHLDKKTLELNRIETPSLDDWSLHELFYSGEEVYMAVSKPGNNGNGLGRVYRLNAENQVEMVSDFPEPLHKVFIVGGDLYAVGNNAIYRLRNDGTIDSIAPEYNGMATTVTVVSEHIIYYGIGGVFEYIPDKGKTRYFANEIYQEIYVVHGKPIGMKFDEQGIKYEVVR